MPDPSDAELISSFLLDLYGGDPFPPPPRPRRPGRNDRPLPETHSPRPPLRRGGWTRRPPERHRRRRRGRPRHADRPLRPHPRRRLVRPRAALPGHHGLPPATGRTPPYLELLPAGAGDHRPDADGLERVRR